MKQSKDPFEAAFVESPPESPNGSEEFDAQTAAADAATPGGGAAAVSTLQNPVLVAREEEEEEEAQEDYDGDYDDEFNRKANASGSGGGNGSGVALAAPAPPISASTSASARTKPKTKDDFDEEDDDNMDVELSKLPSSADPAKMAKMQSILSQFTEHQMSRYESFRRSALQKANMKRLLVSITGTQKISLPMTIVVCGIAKMFVGELIETARVVMTERKESGPIRPCHIREAYRRLKLEGKVPKRSVPRLFR